jgi:hypothetical protein
MVPAPDFTYYSHCVHRGNTTMKSTALLAVALVTLAVSGCAASLVYDSGRSWKQQECYKIPDQYERQRCLQSAAMSYDEYRKTVAQEQAR